MCTEEFPIALVNELGTLFRVNSWNQLEIDANESVVYFFEWWTKFPRWRLAVSYQTEETRVPGKRLRDDEGISLP
jgi:hypothetical protein